MNDLQRRIALELSSDSNDDPEFVPLVCRVVSGELEAKAVQEVFMIRIDNWFDHKWLNFSGIGRVAYGHYTGFSYDPDTSLDEFRQDKKTFPPFTPERVIREHCFVRDETGSYSLDGNAPLIHSQVRAESARNLHRRIRDFSGSALFVWFSSRTLPNRRGSLMIYRSSGGRITSWYSSFSREAAWEVVQTDGIGRKQLEAWTQTPES